VPIYAYRCEACGFAKDALQKVSDAPLTDCPACGEAKFKKQLTAAGFQLKGTGWYVTDFRNGSNAAKPGAQDAAKSDSSAAGSGDNAAAAGANAGADSSSSSSADNGASGGSGSGTTAGGSSGSTSSSDSAATKSASAA